MASEPVTLEEDGNYTINVSEISFDGNRLSVKANGVLYGKSDGSKIDINELTIQSDVNTAIADEDDIISNILCFLGL